MEKENVVLTDEEKMKKSFKAYGKIAEVIESILLIAPIIILVILAVIGIGILIGNEQDNVQESFMLQSLTGEDVSWNQILKEVVGEGEQEFEEMQAWRNLAKKTACEVFGETPSTAYAPSLSELVGQLKKVLRKEVQNLPDEEAMNVPSLFDEWKPGITVKAEERRYFAKELYKCIQGHTTQSDWTPDTTPALWTKVSVDEWPEWVQPTGSHDAYNTGDKVTFEGHHYVSLINGNVWSPTAYPAGWKLES